MRKETDLDAVKETAKILLMTEIHKTDMFPFVSHPFTSNAIVTLHTEDGNCEIVDIAANSDNLHKWQNNIKALINKADNLYHRHLMMVLSALPDIEISCTDSSECFDDNKAYLNSRLEEETNPKIKKTLKRDLEFLDQIQVEMATARQFMFIARCKAKKAEQVFQTANRVEKIISEQGFEVRRMKKEDIKRFLALYFDASFNGEQMPDVDGEQYFETLPNE